MRHPSIAEIPVVFAIGTGAGLLGLNDVDSFAETVSLAPPHYGGASFAALEFDLYGKRASAVVQRVVICVVAGRRHVAPARPGHFAYRELAEGRVGYNASEHPMRQFRGAVHHLLQPVQTTAERCGFSRLNGVNRNRPALS